MTKGAKRATRELLAARRAARGAAERAAAGRELAARVLELAEVANARTVAAYWSFGDEPPTTDVIDALRALGATVLLPVGRDDGDLDWAAHDGTLSPGRWRFLEPGGARLGVDAVASADVVLVPAAAADRTGARLGRGSGSYDRALTRVSPGTPIVALLYDDEVVDGLPVEPHDRPVTAIVTPARVLRI